MRRLGRLLLLLPLLTPRRLLLQLLPLRFRPPLHGASPGPPAKKLDSNSQDRLAQPVRTLLHQRNLPPRSSPRRNSQMLPLILGMLRVRVTLLSPPRYLIRASQTLRRRLRRMLR